MLWYRRSTIQLWGVLRVAKEKAMKEKKPFYKKWWVWLIAFIIVIAAFSGGEETDKAVEEATPVEETATDDTTAEVEDTGTTEEAAVEEETEEVVEEEKIATIGEEVIVGDVHFTVNGTSTATNIGGEYGVDAQSQFLILNVTIQNEKNEAITVDSSFFKLLSGDRTYDSDGTAAIYANENASFLLESVNPGVALTGNVVFDVPADLENMQLQVQTGFFGTETGVISLQ